MYEKIEKLSCFFSKAMTSKFLQIFKPFTRITSEIKQPDREISFKDKIIYTLVVLVIYIIMSNIPIYGITSEEPMP